MKSSLVFRLGLLGLLTLVFGISLVSCDLLEDTPAADTSSQSSGAGSSNWWQVYFTDPAGHGDPAKIKGSIEEKLIAQINNAKSTIHTASFEFNLPEVAQAMIAAQKRGVEVKWITDDESGIQADIDDGLNLFPLMKKAGIGIMDDGRTGLMHNKFWIFDRKIVWTGATNITENGIFKNNNNAIVIESTDLAAIYERQFDDMWKGNFGAKSASTIEQQGVTMDGTPIQVYFSPEDNSMSYLTPLLKAAKKQIRFMAFSFTYDDMGDALLERAKAGVDVSGIFETRGSETDASELCRLYKAKLEVRQDGNPSSFHHKVIVIDNKTVITGSLNFTENADSSNNENVLVIQNSAIAAQYLKEFEQRWAEATPPNAKDMKCK